MTIPFVCLHCASKLSAPDNFAGQAFSCPKCGTSVGVPLATASEAILVAELDDDPPLQNHPSIVSPTPSAITGDWQRQPTSHPPPAANLVPKIPLPWKSIMLGVGISVGLGVVLLLLALFLPWVTLTLGLGFTLAAVYSLAQGGESLHRIIPAGAPPRLSCAGAIIGGVLLLALSATSVVHNRQIDAANRQVADLTEKARLHIISREWDQAESALKDAVAINKAANRSEATALMVQVKEGREQDQVAFAKREAAWLFQKAKSAIEVKDQDQAIALLKRYAAHPYADQAIKSDVQRALNTKPLDVLERMTDEQFGEWLQTGKLPPVNQIEERSIAQFFEQNLRKNEAEAVKRRTAVRLARQEAERKREADRLRKAAEAEARKKREAAEAEVRRKQEAREAKYGLAYTTMRIQYHPDKSGGKFLQMDVLVREAASKQAVMALAEKLRKMYAHTDKGGAVIGIWDSEEGFRKFDTLPEDEAYRHFLAEVQIVGIRDEGECFWVADRVRKRKR